MRFMILCKADENSEAGVMPDKKLFAEMGKFNEELVKAGVMLAAEGLLPSSKGARVRFSGEKRTVMDGPFAETKELIGGFWLWNVGSKEEAIEWLKRAPFDGGAEIEIRQVLELEDFGAVFTPELREQEERIRQLMAQQQQSGIASVPPAGRPRKFLDSDVDLGARRSTHTREDSMENTHATAAEGELALHLYDLRRETELRKARNWFAGEFWPSSFSELEQTMMQFQSPQNHWCRQVMSYWDMAAALVIRGALPPGLFYDTCGEAWFCYAKLKPFLQEGRDKFEPDFMANLEKAIEGTPEGRRRLQRMLERIERFRTISGECGKTQGAEVSKAA